MGQDCPTFTIFQLTRPARGATLLWALLSVFWNISTHTPREGRDGKSTLAVWLTKNFNSHAPRGARRFVFKSPRLDNLLSTHTPREGRDARAFRAVEAVRAFNSHAPRGARPVIPTSIANKIILSTHTPREGRDFLRVLSFLHFHISTHTPREGRDLRNGTAIHAD